MNLKIGTQVYMIHKDYIDKPITGAKILIGKIRTYMYDQGKVVPIIREVGSGLEAKYANYMVTTNLDDAIEALKYKAAGKLKKKK